MLGLCMSSKSIAKYKKKCEEESKNWKSSIRELHDVAYDVEITKIFGKPEMLTHVTVTTMSPLERHSVSSACDRFCRPFKTKTLFIFSYLSR